MLNMRSIFKKVVVKILYWEARAVLAKFKPKIVAVTGSVGKSSTKEAIAVVLATKYRVRKSPKSYNSSLGVPLTILGLSTAWRSPTGWGMTIVRGFLAYFQKDYPEVLVLETGVDRPGDMDVILSIIEPLVSVVTAIGEIPVHVEFFSGPKEIAFEKGKLARRTSSTGMVLLNADDEAVYDMRNEAHGKIVTFGFGKGAEIRVSQYALVTQKNVLGMEIPAGIRCKIDFQGSTVPLRMVGALGKQQLYIASAAIGVGSYFGINPLSAAQAFEEYHPLSGRLRIVEGIKNSILLDDSYNASPMAMHAALDTLRDVPARRRIAALADMLEIGKFTIQAHQAMGELVADFVDILITVGPRAKFIAREAIERGMKRDQVHELGSAAEAGKLLQDILQPGDVVLVKGSQSMRMERAVEEIMAHPELKKDILVRQEEYWKQET